MPAMRDVAGGGGLAPSGADHGGRYEGVVGDTVRPQLGPVYEAAFGGVVPRSLQGAVAMRGVAFTGPLNR